MDNEKTPSASKQPRRAGAEIVQRAEKLRPRRSQRRGIGDAAAPGGIIGRIGDDGVEAAVRKQRPVLPKIAAEDAQTVRKPVLHGVFLRKRGGFLLKLHAGKLRLRIFSAEQKREAPAPAAEGADRAARRKRTEIRQHHRICAQLELSGAVLHPDAAPKLLDHNAS